MFGYTTRQQALIAFNAVIAVACLVAIIVGVALHAGADEPQSAPTIPAAPVATQPAPAPEPPPVQVVLQATGEPGTEVRYDISLGYGQPSTSNTAIIDENGVWEYRYESPADDVGLAMIDLGVNSPDSAPVSCRITEDRVPLDVTSSPIMAICSGNPGGR